MSEEKELNLEENFSRLDQLVELLESEDISLEEAFKAYSQGMELVKRCNERIDRVEKQVLKLGSGGQLEEFEYGSAGI
mgnify:CR=1 FL=1